MIYTFSLYVLLSLGLPQCLDNEIDQVPLVIEQIDAVLGMRDACVAAKYKNDFLCTNILDRTASCKATPLSVKYDATAEKKQLFLEQICFDYRHTRKILKQSNRKCCPTSLSCQKYKKLNRYTYSYPLFCEKKLKALVFVQSKGKYEHKSGELFILVKKRGEWDIEEIIEYHSS